jgi:hypothetical protein
MLPDGILILGGRISSSVLPTNPNVVVWFHGQNGYTLYCYYMKASKTSPWFSDCWLHCLPMALLIPKWHNSFWDWQPQWNTVYIRMRYRYTWYTIHQLALHLYTSMMSRLDKLDKHTSFML